LASRTGFPGTATNTTHLASEDNSLPGGWIGYAEITADSSAITTLVDISGLSQAVTVNTNRKIRITVDLLLDGALDNTVDIYIREGSTTLRRRRFGYPTSDAQSPVHFTHDFNPTSGSHTYKVSALRASGASTNVVKADSGTTWGPSSITIEDIGPSS